MDQNMVLYMAKEAVGAVLLVGGPILGVSLLVGLLVSIFQAMTQIQEQTLTFIPKVVAVVAVLLVLGPWMLSVLTAYTSNLLTQLATFGGL
jgi:flagellar biosynthetic protein FliQ